MIQGAAFASPPKWHLGHTTWFFATFLLEPRQLAPKVPEVWKTLFNSYYNGIGQPHRRDERGILSRPPLADVLAWRDAVDSALLTALEQDLFTNEELALLELGMQHEMQHQELLLTDLLYSLSRNPSLPAFTSADPIAATPAKQLGWHSFDGGLVNIGATGPAFAFDNEYPRHPYHLQPFALADRLVTHAEYQAFIDADGYRDPQWWLSEAWDRVTQEAWCRPLHWLDDGRVYTLHGPIEQDPNAPVCHLSGYEADAFARWAGYRLPTEQEWEHAATQLLPDPVPPGTTAHLNQPGWYGSVWQWTQSAYTPYPGYSPDAGAVGEYNGKFMSSQWVLRGGSFATPEAQQRPTYRNFFYPGDRWQFTGLRLARSERS